MKFSWKAVVATTTLAAALAPITADAVFTDPPAVYIGSAFAGVFNTVCVGVLDGINPVTGQPIDLTDADP